MNRYAKLFLEIFPPLVVALIGGLILNLSVTTKEDQKHVDKSKLFSEMETAINSGAELSDIKQIFENRKYIKRNLIGDIFTKDFSNNKSTYDEPVSLTRVLKDLKSEVFLNKDGNKEFAAKVKLILAEHEKTNPFDKLESNQRIHFETIQSKTGEGYPHIQQDINLIVDELANKNQLVTKYLKDSTLSFRISVFALVIGILAFIPQLVSAWRWWKNKTVGPT